MSQRMPFDEYLKVAAINWSTLKEMRRSPLHYRHRLMHPMEDTARLALGRAIHTAVLEPDRFGLDYAVFEGKRRAGKEWDAFQDENVGRTILKTEELERVMAMRDAVFAHPAAMQRLEGSLREQTLTWTERVSGVDLACKARPDAVGSVIADLKSTKDASAGPFGRTAANFGYHCQLAWYRRGVRAALGRVLDAVLIAVEAEAPHDVAVYRLGEDELWAADEEIGLLLERVARCRADDRWPGANETETPLNMPKWVFGNQESITDDDDIVFGSKGA